MDTRLSLRTATALFTAGFLSVTALSASSRPAPRSPLTPLAEAELFISPYGKPYRSKAGEPYPVVAWFRDTDTNKDGRIDKAEFRAQAEAFFRTLDLNQDGVINDAEISYYERQVVPEIVAGVQPTVLRSGPEFQPHLILAQLGGGGLGGGLGGAGQIDPGGGASSDASPAKQKEDDGPPQGAAPFSLLNDAEPVRSADRSLEGRITLADFLARADHNFNTLDFQGNGYLTLDGLPQTPVQRESAAARRH